MLFSLLYLDSLMVASIAGPRLKLNRAREHLEDLHELMEPFVQGERNRIAIEYNVDTSRKVFWLDPREVLQVREDI